MRLGCTQALTTGPEVARHFAEALTLLYRREADPVDPANFVDADQSAVERLQEVLATVLLLAVILDGRPFCQVGCFVG